VLVAYLRPAAATPTTQTESSALQQAVRSVRRKDRHVRLSPHGRVTLSFMRLFTGLVLCASLAAGQSLSGRRAPSFSLPDSTITQHDILDYRGKWLLLDFMKTDCPHCAALSKTLEQIKMQFGPKVGILSVVISPPESTTTIARYILDNKLTATFVFDQGQVATAYFKMTPAHPSFDTPHLFVINPAGTIAQDWGYADSTAEILEGPGLARELQALMAGGATPPVQKQK